MSVISGIWGAETQKDAIEDSAAMTADWQKYLIALEQRKYDDAAKFRDLAYKEGQTLVGALERQVPLIEEELSKAPEYAKEYYDLASKRGTEDIMSNLSSYGLAKSSVSGKAIGTMQEGISAQEAKDLIAQRQWQTSTRMGLIGRPTGFNPAQGYGDYMSGASQAQSDISQLTVAGGAVQAGLYGSIGQTAAQIPAYYNMGKGLGWWGGAGASAGGYSAASEASYGEMAGSLLY